MSLFGLPRRNPDPKPHSHRAPGRFTRVPEPTETDEPETGEPETGMTLVAADPDATMHLPVVEEDVTPAVRPLPARPPFTVPAEWPPAPVEDPAMTRSLAPLRAMLADARPPGEGPAATGILQRTLDGLRALPDTAGSQQDEPPAPAYLFWVTRDGKPGPHEALAGEPVFAGSRRLADGTPVVGLFFGDEDEDGRLGLDALDRGYVRCLREALNDAEDALWAMEEAGREAAEGIDAA